jgi:hypothetical protein
MCFGVYDSFSSKKREEWFARRGKVVVIMAGVVRRVEIAEVAWLH